MGFYAKKEGYKKPDLNAPRFRRKRLDVLNIELYRKFKKKNPTIKITYKEYRYLVKAYNSMITKMVIHNRDGVELPDQLGYIFIGSCPRITTVPNVDVLNSRELDQKINHKNWGSNQYVCKIFYSNYSTKYKFINRKFWFFDGCRKFTRAVSMNYRRQWNKYIKVSPFSKISFILRSEGVQKIKIKRHDRHRRRIDFSDTQPE